MDSLGIADVFGSSFFLIFGGTFLILLLSLFALFLLFFGFLVDSLKGFLLCSFSISNCLLLGFLGLIILELGLLSDLLVHLCMLLGLLYDLLGLDFGVIQVTLVMVFLVLFFLLGLLLFILSSSLFLVCLLLAIMSSLLGGFGSRLLIGVVGLLRSLSSLLGGIILSFDFFSSFSSLGCRAAAVFTIGITDGLRGGSRFTTALLYFLGLLGFVSHGIGLRLEHCVLDASLDVLVVLLDFMVCGLFDLIRIAFLELSFNRSNCCFVFGCRSSCLGFSSCLSCSGFLDSLVGCGNFISTLLTRCITSGFLLLMCARVFRDLLFQSLDHARLLFDHGFHLNKLGLGTVLDISGLCCGLCSFFFSGFGGSFLGRVLHYFFDGFDLGLRHWSWHWCWLRLLLLLVAAVTKLSLDFFDNIMGVGSVLPLGFTDIFDLADCVVNEGLNDCGVNLFLRARGRRRCRLRFLFLYLWRRRRCRWRRNFWLLLFFLRLSWRLWSGLRCRRFHRFFLLCLALLSLLINLSLPLVLGIFLSLGILAFLLFLLLFDLLGFLLLLIGCFLSFSVFLGLCCFSSCFSLLSFCLELFFLLFLFGIRSCGGVSGRLVFLLLFKLLFSICSILFSFCFSLGIVLLLLFVGSGSISSSTRCSSIGGISILLLLLFVCGIFCCFSCIF